MKKILLGLIGCSILIGCATLDTESKITALMSEAANLTESAQYTGALAVYDQVLNTNEDSADAHAQKGYVYLLQGNVFQALPLINKALELDPNSLYGLTNMGIAESLQGSFDVASAFFDKALAIDPANVQALIHKGNSVADSGALQEAIQYYNKAIAIDPENYLTRFNKGTVLADMGYNASDDSLSDQAINHYQKTLELNPTYHKAHIFKGISLFDQQLFDDALSSLNTGLIELPDDITGLYYKGLTLSQLERTEDAKNTLQKVLEINPGHGYAQQELNRIQ